MLTSRYYMPVVFSIGLSALLPGHAVARDSSLPRPNILICMADDAAHMGAYGIPWVSTPAFDSVARQGLLFRNAFTCNSKSAPSRASFITGRNSWQLREAANHWCEFPRDIMSFPEALEHDGYFTGYTGKGWGPGIAVDSLGNDRYLTGRPYNDIKCVPPTRQINAIDYSANFGAFLRDWDGETPFCFWYGAREPHRKYEYGSGLRAGKSVSDIDSVPSYWPDNDTVRTDMLDYAYEIEYFDRHLGSILSQLDSIGQLDNTIVLVTSDNGMPFPRCKGQEYYQASRLPMAMMWRDGLANPGREVRELIGHIDVVPTLMEIIGMDPEKAGMLSVTGRSFTDIIADSTDRTVDRGYMMLGKERHDVGRPDDQGYPIRGIVRDGYLFVRNYEPARWPSGNPSTGYMDTDGSPTKTAIIKARLDSTTRRLWDLSMGKRPQVELYDIVHDPECVRNLADEPAMKGVIERLEREMTARLTEQGDPRMAGEGHLFDGYPNMCPSRMYWNRVRAGEKKIPHGWISKSDFDPEAEE
ncbi:sulfatase [uncultured Muribaculum sp.]|uniref:sulfatase family protein n=1 Tax=uncultured Muribaculum sp. TaxID=1918613 RepID=UPI0025FF2A7A|nr:sulfatase [uncultured Muribaculum sp.]